MEETDSCIDYWTKSLFVVFGQLVTQKTKLMESVSVNQNSESQFKFTTAGYQSNSKQNMSAKHRIVVVGLQVTVTTYKSYKCAVKTSVCVTQSHTNTSAQSW